MAAYAALVSLMNDLELIPNHPTHSFSFDNQQISSLSQTVRFLIDFMETCDAHFCATKDAEVLENQIASAAHAARGVIESHVVDQIHAGSTLRLQKKTSFLDLVKSEAKKFGSTLGGRAGLDLQKAIDDLDFVKMEAMQIKAKSELKAEQSTWLPPTSSETPTSGKSVMVGFDAVLVQLMEMLTGEPSDRVVIPIVGMGGIGKTTLSRNAYDHSLIQEHFDVLLWATVSQYYSLANILEQLCFGDRNSGTGEDVSVLGYKLHKKLWGRRYLVVLDDIWSEIAWDAIHSHLPWPYIGNGSRVIVTTRLSKVADYLKSTTILNMNFLDQDKSWELFCRKAFGDEECPVELEEIGKKIVSRCQGLPLSIVVIGGSLRKSSRAIEYWDEVANAMNPILSSPEYKQCLNIISLSYAHLPAYLKPCFLYMGIYLEDRWIDASQLIEFWIVEGFIRPKEGMRLEEVAEGYLDDLNDRNLILVRERRWNGKIKYVVLHDIVRDLCLKVGKYENFLGMLQATDTERSPAITLLERYTCGLQLPPLLHSLMHGGRWLLKESSVAMKLLRLSANFQQVNSRYLAFSCERPNIMRFLFESASLPSSISLLWNMQRLIIHNHDVEISAPYEIWEMPQLRHLEFSRVSLPDPEPEDCIVMQNLHTLIGAVDLRLKEGVVKRMPNIKKLSLSYTSFPIDGDASSYHCPQNFSCFTKLESLTCCFGVDSKWREVVLSFSLPSSLEELCLSDSQLRWEDLTAMIKSLPRLGSLELDCVQGTEWDVAEEEFPRLKVLRISRCDDLVEWIANGSNFPMLESLDLSQVPKLSAIPFDIGDIPTLTRIELIGSSAAVAVSAMSIMAEQESVGNYELELDVGFNNRNEFEQFKEIVTREGMSNIFIS